MYRKNNQIPKQLQFHEKIGKVNKTRLRSKKRPISSNRNAELALMASRHQAIHQIWNHNYISCFEWETIWRLERVQKSPWWWWGFSSDHRRSCQTRSRCRRGRREPEQPQRCLLTQFCVRVGSKVIITKDPYRDSL